MYSTNDASNDLLSNRRILLVNINEFQFQNIYIDTLIVCNGIPELYSYQIIQWNFNCGYGLRVARFSSIATTDGWSSSNQQPLLKRHAWAIQAAYIKFVTDSFLLHQTDSYAMSNEFKLRLLFTCRQLQLNCYNWRLVTQTTSTTKTSCLSYTSS